MIRRFLNSIDYIEVHLFEKITPHDIAKIAHFSTFHYCRMFKALAGESVMGYVRKRRLSIAAQRLATEDINILSLALDCQFESNEAFTRAFKKMFRITPVKFKKVKNPLWVNFKKRINQETLEHLQEGISMEPKIIKKSAFMVAGMSDSYNQETNHTIPLLWEQFAPQIHTIPNKKGSKSYGVCVPVGESEFEYIAAVEMKNLDSIPEGMVGKNIPSQTYAVFTHKGSVQKIKETVSYIWSTWIPNSPYESVMAPDFEEYDERFDPVTGEGEIDLYIPIIKQ